jgi:hypothetical protein
MASRDVKSTIAHCSSVRYDGFGLIGIDAMFMLPGIVPLLDFLEYATPSIVLFEVQ